MISIAAVIPLFNGERYISEAIQSVINQTRPVDEILIVNDGSSDRGEDVIRNSFSDKRIIILNKTNGGQSSARNHGVDSAKSSHIAFLDQDDLWHRSHVELLISPFLSCSETAISYGNLDRINEKGWLTEMDYLNNFSAPHPKKRLHDCLSQDMYILPSASIIEKEAFQVVGGFDERLSGYEDDDLFLRLFVKKYKFSYVDKSVSDWREHAASTSHNSKMSKSRMVYFSKLIEDFPDQPELNSFWVRDLIVPRFKRILLSQIALALSLDDAVALDSCLADYEKILQSGGNIRTIKYQLTRFFIGMLHFLGLTKYSLHFIKRLA